MEFKKRLSISLFSLRLGVFIVMFMWTLDKFINPGHAAAVFKKFYFIDGLSLQAAYLVGAVQMLIVIGFLIGFKKKWTYGIVLVMHSVSTFSSFAKYLDPWKSLLFFAAWPMLAACLALFLLRDEDGLFSVSS
ncbi:MAG: hypothetical protein AB8E15_10395 [Bdellovibrionales bacterium]